MPQIRNALLFLMIFSIGILSAVGQKADEKFAELLERNDYFEMMRLSPKLQKEFRSPLSAYLFQTVLHSAFNRPQEACNAADTLLLHYRQQLGPENTMNLVLLRSMNRQKLGDHARNAEELQTSLSALSGQIDDYLLAPLAINHRISQALAQKPASRLIRPAHDTETTARIKTAVRGQHLFIPVGINGQEAEFIFDTGSRYNVVSEAFAREHRIDILCDSIPVRGIGKEFASLGFADTLQIGGMLLTNVPFIIIPPNPAVDTIYQIEAILGSAFMLAAGEIRIFPQEQKIIFPFSQTERPKTGSNLIDIDMQPYLEVRAGNERLLFHFDTGNATADLHLPYYMKHKKQIEKNGTPEKVYVGGIGAVQELDTYRLPEFKFRIGDTPCEIDNIQVNTGTVFAEQGNEDGALGMDFILLFRKIIINFDHMFVEAES